MTPESLARAVNDFLAGANEAVVVEEGTTVFELARSKYSISGEYNKCLLHLWSAERNVVRRVLDAEVKNDVLRLAVQRLGQTRPTKLEICRERDRRTPTAKRAARVTYRRRLQHILERRFHGFKIGPLSTSMDLEHSFGPIYARGMLRQGQSAFAVLGVNSQETQATIDAALTFAIIWLDVCRHTHAAKWVIEGLKLFVPPYTSAIVRERMALLSQDAAKWHLYEFDEREDSLREIDLSDRGNVATRLVHATDEAAARERFSTPISQVRAIMPEAELAVLSGAEVAFRCHGLEFARARLAQNPASFSLGTEIVFGLGAEERVLTSANFAEFTRLVRSIGEARHFDGPRESLLWRLHPERWLESLVVQSVRSIDERLDPCCLYSQLPAFSASDRALIDVLTATQDGRLAVVELKADEDIHLPVQGLDYWSRVVWHHDRAEFQRFGYFPGKILSAERPLLFLVAPVLHVHPATDTMLRYISPDVEWVFVEIGERWRQELKVISRKRRPQVMKPQAFRHASLEQNAS